MEAADKAARIVRTVVETLKPGFAVRLWTGERIGPASGPVLVINDQDIVWQMVRRPSFSTLIEMWISKTVATKRARGPSGLPPTRADLYR
ncbi:hypothetical protein NKJ26_10920 [Mesorhizobium sp. M0152]